MAAHNVSSMVYWCVLLVRATAAVNSFRGDIWLEAVNNEATCMLMNPYVFWGVATWEPSKCQGRRCDLF